MRIIPNTAEDLIEDLEEHYPPRCMEDGESLEAHLRYAGMVDLIQNLRLRLEYTKDSARLEDLIARK